MQSEARPTITPADIARLRELEAKRTPGLWVATEELRGVHAIRTQAGHMLGETASYAGASTNADFIVACSDLVGPMLDEIERNAWRPIGEAPRDGSEIMAIDHLDLHHLVRWNPDGACWTDGAGHTVTMITHWRPLPASPRGEID